MRIIKDLIGDGKKYPGVPILDKNTKEHSVSTVKDLMIKVKKGSGQYRKIIASRRDQREIHNPHNWRIKLNDETITSFQLKAAMKLMHSKYLVPRIRDRLCDLFHNRTTFGAGLLKAGKTQEEWCKTCYRENNGEIVREKILHAMYECPSVAYVRGEIFPYYFPIIFPVACLTPFL